MYTLQYYVHIHIKFCQKTEIRHNDFQKYVDLNTLTLDLIKNDFWLPFTKAL